MNKVPQFNFYASFLPFAGLMAIGVSGTKATHKLPSITKKGLSINTPCVTLKCVANCKSGKSSILYIRAPKDHTEGYSEH